MHCPGEVLCARVRSTMLLSQGGLCELNVVLALRFTSIRTFSRLLPCLTSQSPEEQTREQGDDIRKSQASDDETLLPKSHNRPSFKDGTFCSPNFILMVPRIPSRRLSSPWVTDRVDG